MLLAGFCLEAAAKGGRSGSSYSYSYRSSYNYNGYYSGSSGDGTGLGVIGTIVVLGVLLIVTIVGIIYKKIQKKRDRVNHEERRIRLERGTPEMQARNAVLKKQAV